MDQSLEEFQRSLTGDVFLPKEYRHFPLRWLPFEEHTGNQLVVFPFTVSDVQQTVGFAHRRDQNIVIQTSGHGTIAVNCPQTIILFPHLCHREEIIVDSKYKTVRIPAGTKWGEVNKATLPYSLIALCGSSPDVSSIGSYPFYGGISVMERLRGLVVDDILALDMVTANGAFIRVNREYHSDLFWAMCGGGGNFGVVTAMTLRLHPVIPIQRGVLMYPLMDNPVDEAREILFRYRNWSMNAPRELLSVVAIKLRSGSDEKDQFDKKHILIELYCCGKPELFTDSMDFWIKWKKPEGISSTLVDHMPPDNPIISGTSLSTTSGGQTFPYLSDAVLEVAIHYGVTCPVLTNVLIRHIGGAMNDHSPEKNAVAFRGANYVLSLFADVPDCHTEQEYKKVADLIDLAVSPDRMGDYLPFLLPKYIPSFYPRAFKEKYSRLLDIKHRYDPNHIFCGGGMPNRN